MRPQARASGRPASKERPSYAEAWALVTVEGERLYRREVVHLTRRSTLFRVPLTAADYPGVEVNVAIVQEKQIYQWQLRTQCRARGAEAAGTRHERQIAIFAGRNGGLHHHDEGFPRAAGAGRGRLGVVDASIYAIEPDNSPDIESAFYSGQQVRIETGFSFAAQYSGGAYQTMPAAPGSGTQAGGIRVRRQFADTAYWNAFVTTDATGTGRVTFTMPDNLTTWRATARAITVETHVGSTTQEVVATMPLLVRLTLPRFTVEGDRVMASGIVHNYTGAARDVSVTIDASGATVQGDFDAAYPPFRRRRTAARLAGVHHFNWRSARRHGRRSFRVAADGGEGARDAMELTLPALADGLKMVDVKAAALANSGDVSRLDIGKLPRDATLTVTLTPTLVSALFGALDYLTSYPYGCAEQTMSGLLPDIAVAQALRKSGLERPVEPDLPGWINLGLQKLYRYQHPDGGWQWWEFDETDGDMTAYVLWGLVQARDAGYLVDEMRIRRGTEALLQLLSREQEWNRRVEWMLTLALARPDAIDQPLVDAHVNWDKLDTYGLAALALAEAQIGALPGHETHRRRAAVVAREIEAKAIRQGTTAYWLLRRGWLHLAQRRRRTDGPRPAGRADSRPA